MLALVTLNFSAPFVRGDHYDVKKIITIITSSTSTVKKKVCRFASAPGYRSNF